MKCPHCRVEFHDKPESTLIGVDTDGWMGFNSKRLSSM
jgi:hypothetical protein